MTTLVKNPHMLSHMRREALRVAGPSPELFRYIRQHSLNVDTCLANVGFLTVALVEFLRSVSGHERFLFDADGEPAVVIEALLFDRERQQVCSDLVAWPLHKSERVATAMGINDGADVLGPQSMVGRNGERLCVYRTPLAWLQAECNGCVLLKSGARHWLLQAGGPFVAEDITHGHELRSLLGSAAADHRIIVKNQFARSAA